MSGLEESLDTHRTTVSKCMAKKLSRIPVVIPGIEVMDDDLVCRP